MYVPKKTVRKRVLQDSTTPYHTDVIPDLPRPPLVTKTAWSFDPWNMTQYTESESHPWHSKPREKGDLGGPFLTRKIEQHSPIPATYDLRRPMGGAEHTRSNVFVLPRTPLKAGVFSTGGDHSVFTTRYDSSDSQLRAFGTQAIARCSPVSPLASAATSLGELMREGLPSVVGLQAAKKPGAKGAAGEYLNWQFGIAPVISDFKDLAKSIQHQDKLLRQLRRDSGKLVRRRYKFDIAPELVSQTETPGATAYVGASNLWYSVPQGKGTLVREVKKTTRRWFEGAFTYHLADAEGFSKVARWAQEAERLYGLTPDVADVWNLLPWSWLSDWALNTGDVLQNVSSASQFGLVMPYGYMMETTIVEYSYTLSGLTIPWAPKTVKLRYTDTVKKRIQASPFGFGVTWDGLSVSQATILAALGITRLR